MRGFWRTTWQDLSEARANSAMLEADVERLQQRIALLEDGNRELGLALGAVTEQRNAFEAQVNALNRSNQALLDAVNDRNWQLEQQRERARAIVTLAQHITAAVQLPFEDGCSDPEARAEYAPFVSGKITSSDPLGVWAAEKMPDLMVTTPYAPAEGAPA